MLEVFKRLFSHVPATGADLREAASWARLHGFGFKRVRDEGGFVIDGVLQGDRPWRLEWGPPQRPYITGRELRLRIELRLPSDVQMLVLSRELMEKLERQTYEQFVEGTQTQIDTSTPEEVRWLVMFPKVSFGASKGLRSNYGAVAAAAAMGALWIDGPLARQLERAQSGLLRDQPPFVLMTLRGRLYLRLQLEHPDAVALDSAFVLFSVACEQAVRVAGSRAESGPEWPSSGSTAWQSLHPDEPGAPR